MVFSAISCDYLMNSNFYYIQNESPELKEFPFVSCLLSQKVQQIILDSWEVGQRAGIGIFSFTEGKYEWSLEHKTYPLYPNDSLIVQPWQELGNPRGYLEIGAFMQLSILPSHWTKEGHLILGDWSKISYSEQVVISKLFLSNAKPIIPRNPAIGQLIMELGQEVHEQAFGYRTRVPQIVDEILITWARTLGKTERNNQDFSQTFLQLEQTLRANLEHPWTLEEMAGLAGLGNTAFSEKVKRFSGFSPLNYLINIRIAEASRLLKSSDKSLTDIALETGFYSSQHFSTTFKKLTGYTPRDYRKIHI